MLSERATRLTARAKDARAEYAKRVSVDSSGFLAYAEDKPTGVRVQRHPMTDGTNDFFKVVGTVNLPPLRCAQVVADKSRMLEWDPAFAAEEVVEKWEVDGIKYELYRNQHSSALGGIVSAREMVNVRCIETKPDGSIHLLAFSVDTENDTFPSNPAFVRAWNYPSMTIFNSKGENQSELIFMLHISTGGSLPFWMVKGGISKQLIDVIAFLQKVARE